MKLQIDSEVLNAERIIRKGNDLLGYDKGNVVFHFGGVKDFNAFRITDDEGNPVEFERELTQEEQLQRNLENLGQMFTDSEIQNTELGQTLTDLELRLLAVEADK